MKRLTVIVARAVALEPDNGDPRRIGDGGSGADSDARRGRQEGSRSAEGAARCREGIHKRDLPSAQTPAAASGPGTAAPVDPVAAATAEKPAEPKPEGEAKPEGETKDEAWWKNRMMSTREELRRNEMFAEALQTRINALSRDYTSRDNPAQRQQIGQERAESLTELNRVKQDVERGKKQIADLEEEARKAAFLLAGSADPFFPPRARSHRPFFSSRTRTLSGRCSGLRWSARATRSSRRRISRRR